MPAADTRAFRSRYQKDPTAAVYTYRARTNGGPGDPLRAEAVVEHGGVRYPVAVNEKIGGPGDEPTPGDLMLAALVSCKALAIQMVAASMRIELADLSVDAEAEVDHRGVLMMGGVRPGFLSIRCRVRVAAKEGTPREAVERMLAGAEQCCAVTDTYRNGTPIETAHEIA
jgi:putative redox protein